MNFKLVTILGAQIALVGECERGGAKRRLESIVFVDENSKVAPPGLSSFRHPCAAQFQLLVLSNLIC